MHFIDIFKKVFNIGQIEFKDLIESQDCDEKRSCDKCIGYRIHPLDKRSICIRLRTFLDNKKICNLYSESVDYKMCGECIYKYENVYCIMNKYFDRRGYVCNSYNNLYKCEDCLHYDTINSFCNKKEIKVNYNDYCLSYINKLILEERDCECCEHVNKNHKTPDEYGNKYFCNEYLEFIRNSNCCSKFVKDDKR